jgi:AraC family transcriptional regulator of adaptative response/methylated-DNA-[protein]-cysteine methyltransferase
MLPAMRTSSEAIGSSPRVRARAGPAPVLHWTVAESSLGPVLVAASDKGVCRVAFGEGEAELRARFPAATLVLDDDGPGSPLLAAAVAACENPAALEALPLDLAGTPFQQAIWRELRRIPLGETRSYAELAAAAGAPRAIRAAGSANAANPVAVLVPCHRVIRSDGTIGGYAYGVEIKRKLLEREQAPS